ncbi:heat-inducible transcriptional repressor HrcA [Bifidobacterium sp. ESL0798]|uniref:heat-inducible transcriptional repressor HrcA n=1 Tax=unclassified Bifidobacterium TaxID=2608897 RepID=UPI0023F66848|nr:MULTISPECIES: heat-inducible transcriptional repressor HrcA [unclassified Bifidobacterium]WEV52268.1 heat-inducible transcriptional repressor HrcA [Bifidobacterium sp. ESL0704]WEV74783.1 heat-inducible transcriptional repressor HrcA [Bifidobacterium sp. ESL0798]
MAQSRRMLVLRAVVEDYIRSQEPVGSTALTRAHDLGVSSATIRNDMSALEEEGYLIQPHTSAGRIPTERGYRYFVDRLASLVPLSEAQRRGITTFLSGSVSLSDTLQRAARLLANITGQVAVVSSPALSKSKLRHIEIVPLNAVTMLAVIITDSGSVAQHTFTLRQLPDTVALNRFSGLVNEQCMDMPLVQASQHIRSIVKAPEYNSVRPLGESLAKTVESMAHDEGTGQMYMAGTSQLAHQQSRVDLAPLFDALEEQVVIMHLMSDLSQGDGEVGVAIGSETRTPGLIHASVVSSGYGRSKTDEVSDAGNGSGKDEAMESISRPVAFVGSIGPTHMDYETTITAVRAVARYLTDLIASDETA